MFYHELPNVEIEHSNQNSYLLSFLSFNEENLELWYVL